MTAAEILIKVGVGAIIGGMVGYLTNRIAIWMLFNPRRTRRLGARRLPFTPGLLVQKQPEMARNIGRTVGENLLRPEAIVERITEDEMTAEMGKAVGNCIEDIADRDLPCIAELVGPQYAEHLVEFKAPFKAKIRDGLRAFLTGERTRQAVLEVVEAECERYMQRPIERWVDTERREKLARWIVDSLREHLDRGTADQLIDEGSRLVTTQLTDGANEEFDMIKRRLLEIVRGRSDHIATDVIQHVRTQLDNPRTEFRIRRFMIEKSQRVSQRILHQYVSPTSLAAPFLNLDRVLAGIINEHWSVIHEEMVRGIESAEAHQMVVENVHDLADNLADAPADAIISPAERFELGHLLRQGIRNFLTHGLDYAAIEEALYRWLTEQCRRPVEEFLPKWRELLRSAADRFIGDMTDTLDAGRWEQALDGVLDEAFRVLLYDLPLGRPKEWIPAERRSALSAAAATHLQEKLVRAVPAILEHIDVPEIIEREINRLEPTQIEQTVRAVSDRELRAIVWFGGFAGVLVGGVIQPVLALFLR